MRSEATNGGRRRQRVEIKEGGMMRGEEAMMGGERIRDEDRFAVSRMTGHRYKTEGEAGGGREKDRMKARRQKKGVWRKEAPRSTSLRHSERDDGTGRWKRWKESRADAGVCFSQANPFSPTVTGGGTVMHDLRSDVFRERLEVWLGKGAGNGAFMLLAPHKMDSSHLLQRGMNAEKEGG